MSEWSLHYGYLDAKPQYFAKGSIMGEIHIKIRIKDAKYIWLCGAAKESLMHATVYLDANVQDIGADWKQKYSPSANRVQLTKHQGVGNECKEFSDLPEGTHVVSISTDAAQPSHTTALTHVIMWP